MNTLLKTVRQCADYLAKKGVKSPKLEAEWLVASFLGLSRIDIFLEPERPLNEAELASLRGLLERRGKREPLQYLLGQIDFLGCKLEVTPDVLIPRPETEILADRIVQDLPGIGVFWDLCTGSGCLAIAIKKKRPQMAVVASDVSPRALEVARKNAQKNGVDIEFRLGDLLEPFKGEKADFVSINPPYVSEKEFELLEPEVRLFEPKGALVSGPSGTEFYERLARELPKYLNSGAHVWLELGPHSSVEYFCDPCWGSKQVEKDYSGAPRFFSLKFKEDMRMLSR